MSNYYQSSQRTQKRSTNQHIYSKSNRGAPRGGAYSNQTSSTYQRPREGASQYYQGQVSNKYEDEYYPEEYHQEKNSRGQTYREEASKKGNSYAVDYNRSAYYDEETYYDYYEEHSKLSGSKQYSSSSYQQERSDSYYQSSQQSTSKQGYYKAPTRGQKPAYGGSRGGQGYSGNQGTYSASYKRGGGYSNQQEYDEEYADHSQAQEGAKDHKKYYDDEEEYYPQNTVSDTNQTDKSAPSKQAPGSTTEEGGPLYVYKQKKTVPTATNKGEGSEGSQKALSQNDQYNNSEDVQQMPQSVHRKVFIHSNDTPKKVLPIAATNQGSTSQERKDSSSSWTSVEEGQDHSSSQHESSSIDQSLSHDKTPLNFQANPESQSQHTQQRNPVYQQKQQLQQEQTEVYRRVNRTNPASISYEEQIRLAQKEITTQNTKLKQEPPQQQQVMQPNPQVFKIPSPPYNTGAHQPITYSNSVGGPSNNRPARGSMAHNKSIDDNDQQALQQALIFNIEDPVYTVIAPAVPVAPQGEDAGQTKLVQQMRGLNIDNNRPSRQVQQIPTHGQDIIHPYHNQDYQKHHHKSHNLQQPDYTNNVQNINEGEWQQQQHQPQSRHVQYIGNDPKYEERQGGSKGNMTIMKPLHSRAELQAQIHQSADHILQPPGYAQKNPVVDPDQYFMEQQRYGFQPVSNQGYYDAQPIQSEYPQYVHQNQPNHHKNYGNQHQFQHEQPLSGGQPLNLSNPNSFQSPPALIHHSQSFEPHYDPSFAHEIVGGPYHQNNFQTLSAQNSATPVQTLNSNAKEFIPSYKKKGHSTQAQYNGFHTQGYNQAPIDPYIAAIGQGSPGDHTIEYKQQQHIYDQYHVQPQTFATHYHQPPTGYIATHFDPTEQHSLTPEEYDQQLSQYSAHHQQHNPGFYPPQLTLDQQQYSQISPEQYQLMHQQQLMYSEPASMQHLDRGQSGQ